MQAVQLLLPAIATAALGTALLVPLRDERRGRRATLSGGSQPLRAQFPGTSSQVQPPSERVAPVFSGAEFAERDDQHVDAKPPSSFATLAPKKAVVNPLLAIKQAWCRYVNPLATVTHEAAAGDGGADPVASLVEDADATPHIVRRSFAAEVAVLLGRPPAMKRPANDPADAIALQPRANENLTNELPHSGSKLHEESASRSAVSIVSPVNGNASTSAPAPDVFPSNAGPSVSPVNGNASTSAPAPDVLPFFAGPSVSPVKGDASTSGPARDVLPFSAGPIVSPANGNASTSAPAPDVLPFVADAVAKRGGLSPMALAPAQQNEAGLPADVTRSEVNRTPVDVPYRAERSEASIASLSAKGHDVAEEANGDSSGAPASGNSAATGRPRRTSTYVDREVIERKAGAVTESAQEIVVTTVRPAVERIVPLTRLPLRPQARAVTWPSFQGRSADVALSRERRHAILQELLAQPASLRFEVIELAYRQEDAGERAVALRVIARHFPHDGAAIFREALRSGYDEERSIAIDTLAASGARDELTFAFGDRLEALAAKAALAYVATSKKEDYRRQLAPFAETARIDAILKLLAGIVE